MKLGAERKKGHSRNKTVRGSWNVTTVALAAGLVLNVAICVVTADSAVPSQLHNITVALYIDLSAYRFLCRRCQPRRGLRFDSTAFHNEILTGDLNMLETRINNRIPDQQKENSENVGSKDLPQTLVSEIDETYFYAAEPAWRDVREKILGVREADREQTYKSLRRLLSTMRDSELNLLDPPELDALRRETAGEVLATGIMDFALDFAPGSTESRLVTPLIGSPAALAGLRPRDILVFINGKRTSEMDHESVLDELRSHGSIELSIRRGRQRLAVTLMPSTEPLKSVSFQAVHNAAGIVGVIRVAQFTPDSAVKVRDAFDGIEREHPCGYILDLRNNPGGLLDQATKVAGLFLSGDLGAKVRRNGKIEPIRVDNSPATQVPLAVLVNEGSASAAEFVAGALQARHRAVLIGAHTYGRGQAQILKSLPAGYALVIPSAVLRTPNGTLFKRIGLSPDMIVRSDSMARPEIDPNQDPQLRKAIAVIGNRVEQDNRRRK